MEPLRSTPLATWPAVPLPLPLIGALFVLCLATFGVGTLLASPLVTVSGFVLSFFAWIADLLSRPRHERLSLGADGVAIAGGARRFVPFGQIERVERDGSRLGQTSRLAFLVLDGGERVRIGTRHFIIGPDARREVDAAYDDLERALAAYRARQTAEHAETLARGDRPSAEWIGELRARARGGGFRDGTLVGRAALLAIVEDPTADPTARAGAAYALRTEGLGDEDRSRVRVAAAATAAPKVRVALETAADDAADDDHVSATVARVDARG